MMMLVSRPAISRICALHVMCRGHLPTNKGDAFFFEASSAAVIGLFAPARV